MRDNLDFRQAYVDLHLKRVKLFAGRQLLNFGNERVIGISDWTQTIEKAPGLELVQKSRLEALVESLRQDLDKLDDDDE